MIKFTSAEIPGKKVYIRADQIVALQYETEDRTQIRAGGTWFRVAHSQEQVLTAIRAAKVTPSSQPESIFDAVFGKR